MSYLFHSISDDLLSSSGSLLSVQVQMSDATLLGFFFSFQHPSIIQGSVIGPPSYVVAASDLHPRSALNCLMKYADDTYLLVGSNNISTVADEFAHINA